MKSKLSCALLFAIAVSLNTLSAYAAAGAVYTLNNSRRLQERFTHLTIRVVEMQC